MVQKKKVILHNQNRKPDNILRKELEIRKQCEDLEKELPRFMNGFFAYLRVNVLPMTRLAYLRDILFFCNYLINETDLVSGKSPKDLREADFDKIEGVDVNLFLDYCRSYKIEKGNSIHIYENDLRSLSRKKSSLSVLFKHLYREGYVSRNITDGFNPIRVPKPGEREIKTLQDDEVMKMLDAVVTGEHLTTKEKEYWKKTKYRDKAILLLFLTYGLRISELQQLNVSSFHFGRDEFTIYRKRGKESVMPLNQTVRKAVLEYIELERPDDDTLETEHKDALFLSLQKKRMTERQIREMVKKYTSIGLETTRSSGYSPHKLRATAATSLIGRGNSIYDVQELLDHDNVTTTQLYAAHRKNARRDLIRNFEWGEDMLDPDNRKNQRDNE
ncbi:MAG: tyrosine-type recombinase/integrase [Anaerovoracaceae bacterium]|jgi:site-specific recombinase XerD